MNLNEKWSKLSNKGKLTIGLVGLVCVVAVVSSSTYANNQAQKKWTLKHNKQIIISQ